MAITVVVRAGNGEETQLCFDGIENVVVGRGASCDVRLPDTSVSHRHASLRMKGGNLVLVDEGSTNGTYVGGVRVASHTSRVIRSGERVRLGRLSIEVRVEQAPPTRDVALATRDLAFALVAAELDARGAPRVLAVQVVEGADQGAGLALEEEGRPYVLGRGETCDLPLADVDASREHAQVIRTGGDVVLRDLGAKNGTWIGDFRLPARGESAWRSTHMARIGRTVLALRQPVADELARVEQAADELLAAEDVAAPAEQAPPPANSAAVVEPAAVEQRAAPSPPSRRRQRWSPFDLAVIAAAACVLVASLAGLVWLLR